MCHTNNPLVHTNGIRLRCAPGKYWHEHVDRYLIAWPAISGFRVSIFFNPRLHVSDLFFVVLIMKCKTYRKPGVVVGPKIRPRLGAHSYLSITRSGAANWREYGIRSNGPTMWYTTKILWNSIHKTTRSASLSKFVFINIEIK